jgi:hypothetical protein
LKFYVDPTNITPSRGYKLGDLVNIFPDGVVLHEQYKNELQRNILMVVESMESRLHALSREEQKKIMKQYGFLGNEDDEEEEEFDETKIEEKKNKKKEIVIEEAPPDSQLAKFNNLIKSKKLIKKEEQRKKEKLELKEELKKTRKKFISFKKQIMQESIQLKDEFKTDDGKGKKGDDKGGKAANPK